MEDWRLATIIGVIGAFTGVYFRESVRKALRQKTLASKLEAQVNDLLQELIKSDLLQALAIAEVWREDRKKALLEKGTKGFIEVEKKYEEKLGEIKRKIEEGDEEIDEKLRGQHKVYKEMSERIFTYHIEQLEIARDALFKNVGFMSEDEAAEISWDTVAMVVAVRTSFIKLIHQSISFALMLREVDEPELEALRTLVYSVVEQSIRLALQLEPLRTKARLIRARSVVSLTIENMVGKP